MASLMIIADDLTGAIDAGVHFAEKGLYTTVVPEFNPEKLQEHDFSAMEVLVINTESRHIAPDEAAGRVTLAARLAQESGIGQIYKKTDSTLRGNIGAELEALLRATGKKRMPFIPAYPALKRYTRSGFHYVGDKQLHQTHFAGDPLEPVISSFIPEIIGKQSGCKNTVLSFPYRNFLPGPAEHENEILIYDCSSEEELRDIEKNLEENKLLGLVAGSAAVGFILAGRMINRKKGKESINLKGPSLLVNGSLNSVTIEQVSLADSPRVVRFYLEPFFLNSGSLDVTRMNSLIRQINDHARIGFDILVSSTVSREELDQFHLEKYGPAVPSEAFTQAAEIFGKFISELLKTIDFAQIVVMGGDTLMALIRTLEIPAIRPITEMLPGVVISEAIINGKTRHLITKPGGYGTPDTLIRILEYIKNK
jgi:D-threonate/D-erythronate kinase